MGQRVHPNIGRSQSSGLCKYHHFGLVAQEHAFRFAHEDPKPIARNKTLRIFEVGFMKQNVKQYLQKMHIAHQHVPMHIGRNENLKNMYETICGSKK
jgi:hypothetical protein